MREHLRLQAGEALEFGGELCGVTARAATDSTLRGELSDKRKQQRRVARLKKRGAEQTPLFEDAALHSRIADIDGQDPHFRSFSRLLSRLCRASLAASEEIIQDAITWIAAPARVKPIVSRSIGRVKPVPGQRVAL